MKVLIDEDGIENNTNTMVSNNKIVCSGLTVIKKNGTTPRERNEITSAKQIKMNNNFLYDRSNNVKLEKLNLTVNKK